MKLDDVKALPDSELAAFVIAAQEEQKARAEKRKQETIAKIKELASAEGLSVSIAGLRGRPPKNGHKRPANDNNPVVEKLVSNAR